MSSITSFLANTTGNILLPRGTSTIAKEVDFAFYFILGISAFFFLLIMTLIVLFVKRYRHRKNGPKANIHITHNTTLEVVWSVIPLILLIFIFVLGYRGYLKMIIPPANALQINVTGQKWNWSFEYPTEKAVALPSQNGDSKVVEFAVPKGKSVVLRLTSRDVLHSFFIPNFRLKADAVPRQYTELSFEATEEGTYPVFCAEYCGTDHSRMLATLLVLPEEKYKQWLKDHPSATNPIDKGKELFNARCTSCHAIEQGKTQPSIGPNLFKVYGKLENVTVDGVPQQVKVDANYIRESLEYPNAKIVKGFTPQMPSFKGDLKEDNDNHDISNIIEYIKSLK